MAELAPKPQDYTNRSSWERRPWLARVIRTAVFVVPIVGAILTTTALGAVVFRSSWMLGVRLGWIALMFVVATVVSNLLARWTGKLLPLSALCRMNLNFPEEAPSRVKTALRMGNTANGERVIEQFMTQGLAPDPQEAALEVLDLIEALNRHDRQTRGHTEKVRALTEVIATELGLGEAERNRLRWASVLHDIGKLAVPAAILNKPGKPTAEEWVLIQSHPMAGHDRMGSLREWLGESARAVEEHHERWDGNGYPRKLRGEEIALAARIVAVADSFEVMTAVRSYKKPMSYEDARAELVKCSGTHFDPVVVRAFLSVGTKKTRMSAGFFSSIISHLASGNGPVATMVQTVSGGVSASAGASIAAPFVRGMQLMASSAPESGIIFSGGGAGTLLASPIRSVSAAAAAAKATFTTIVLAATSTVAPAKVPDNLALRDRGSVTAAEADRSAAPTTTPSTLPAITPSSPQPTVRPTPTTIATPTTAVAPYTPGPVDDGSTLTFSRPTVPEPGIGDRVTITRPPSVATITTPTATTAPTPPTTIRPTTTTASATTKAPAASTTTRAPTTTTRVPATTTVAPTTTQPPPPPPPAGTTPPATTPPATAAPPTTVPATTTTSTTSTTIPTSCPSGWLASYSSGAGNQIRCESTVDLSLGAGVEPALGIASDFEATWTGTIALASAQPVLFETTADDVASLYIDGSRVFRQGSIGSVADVMNSVTEKYLTAGSHTIQFRYTDRGGPARASLAITPSLAFSAASAGPPSWVALPPSLGVPDPCASGEWSVRTFGNTDLSGPPAASVCDAMLDESYQSSKLPPGLSDHRNFSAVWVADFVFPAGSTKVSSWSAESLRIWVDGREILENWGVGAYNETWSTLRLRSGVHRVVVAYKNGNGNGRVKVTMSPTPTAPPTTTTTSMTAPSTTTTSTTTPVPPTTTTTTASSTSTTTTPPVTTTTTTGSSTSTTTTPPVTTTTTATTTTTTTTTIPTAGCTALQWKADYFNGQALGPVADKTVCLNSLSYFESNAPTGITDVYAARFTAKVLVATPGIKTFRWVNDGEFGLSIDRTEIASRRSFDDGNATFNSASVNMSAGLHEVQFEMIDRTGSSAISFAFAPGMVGPSSGIVVARPPSPTTSDACAGWYAKYVAGPNYSDPAASTSCITGDVDEDWGTNAPSNVPGDVFNAQYTKLVTFTGGLVSIDYTADDEFSMWIDGVLITDTTGYHYDIIGRTQIDVAAGVKQVIVRMRDLGGGAAVRFSITP